MRGLSRDLDQNEGYISDFLSKGSPETLDLELRMKIAKMLNIEPSLLGASDEVVDSGVPHNDATVYVPAPGDAISPQPHTVYLRVTSLSIDDHAERIGLGQIAAFDSRVNELRKLKTGMIVHAERRRGKRVDVLIRQFIAPDKLVTNSSTANEVLRVDENIAIKGAFLYVFRGLGGG